MKKTIVLLPIVFMLHSCLYLHEKYVSTLSEIKYGDPTEIISNKGFYTSLDTGFIPEKGVNPYCINIIFFPDQTVCYFFFRDDSLNSNDAGRNFEKCIHKWGRKKNKWGVSWGVYTKRNDSIYTDMYDLMGPFYPPALNICKDFFLLRNDTLIRKRRWFVVKDERSYDIERHDVYVYVQADSVLEPSNHFIKKKKWIWRNPDEWMEYMESSDK